MIFIFLIWRHSGLEKKNITQKTLHFLTFLLIFSASSSTVSFQVFTLLFQHLCDNWFNSQSTSSKVPWIHGLYDLGLYFWGKTHLNSHSGTDSAARISEANRTDIKLLRVNLVYCMLKYLVYIVVCLILSDILTCVNKPNLEAAFLEWRKQNDVGWISRLKNHSASSILFSVDLLTDCTYKSMSVLVYLSYTSII